jgi:hypothetical protein
VKNPIRDLVLGATVTYFIAAGAQPQSLAWLRWLLAVAAQKRRRWMWRIRRFVGTCRDFPLHD